MGMHDHTDRLRQVIAGLTHFYNRRYEELRGSMERFGKDFRPELADLDDPNIDQPYYAYIQELSKGVDQLLAKLNVSIDPVPPGPGDAAMDEVLMGGARMLKWTVTVSDGSTGDYIGRLEWAIYRRHDRFAVPGPAHITYLKARGGRTIMVG